MGFEIVLHVSSGKKKPVGDVLHEPCIERRYIITSGKKNKPEIEAEVLSKARTGVIHNQRPNDTSFEERTVI